MIRVLILIAIFIVADRLLLWCEARGWIYYRRYGLRRGAATYHLLEMSSVFDPGFKQITEVKTEEKELQDEAGDPPVED